MWRKRRLFLPLPNFPSALRTANCRSPRTPRVFSSTSSHGSPSIDLTG